MKKIFTLFAALVCMVSMFAATETVYFVNASKWSGTINAYAWTSTPNANWPGVKATKEAEQLAGCDVYSYTAEAGKYANIIFNNGSSQTADLKWTAGKYYCKDGWYTKEDAAAKLGQPIEYETVYFVNVQGWSKVNIYTWTPEVGTWPGVAMTKEADKLAGKDVYSYTVEKGTSFGGMLFNNGSGTQTGDLKWTAGKYLVNNTWYTKEEAEAAIGIPVVDSWTMVGDAALFGTAWDLNAKANEMVKQADGSYALTLTNKTLDAKSYEYKAAKNHSWDVTVPGGDNAKLTVDKKGQYDITFTLNAAATSVTAKATYIPATYTVTATAENGTVTGAGKYKEGAEATLTATPAEGYQFVNWTKGGEVVSAENPYAFVVTENVELVANFKAVEATVYTISIEAVNGTVTGAGVYEEGATVTLTATPADGYNFKNWTVSSAEVSAENPYIFTATADVTVTANFEEIPVEYETVYFVNAQDWEKVCIYTWTPEIGTWPGKEMTKEAEQIGGKDVYSYTIEKGTTFVGLNFNNGNNGKQTGDLTWTAGKYYVIDGWYTRSEAEEKLAVPVPTYDYYVVGTFNSWANPDPNHGMTLVGDVYKATVTLNVGANMLKVTNGTWDNAKGFDAMGAEYEEVSNDTKDGNILITLTEGKDVVVVYNATTGKVTFEGLTEKVVVTPDVITYVLMGVAGDWTTGIAMTQNPDNANEYVLLGQEIAEGDAVKVVTLVNGVAEAYCGAVEKASPVKFEFDNDGNIVLLPGKYDFYFKVNDPTTDEDDAMYIAGEAYPVDPEVPTALDNVDTTVAPAKAIVNGQLVITKDGVQYNAQGAILK